MSPQRTSSGQEASDPGVRLLRVEEAAGVTLRSAAAFGTDADAAAVALWEQRCEAGEVWGVEDGGQVVAHCRLLPTDHWFGGRLVPCLDVAAVAVAPEHRGRGYASRLMRSAIEIGAAQGAGLSLLFPATTRLYRMLGWEHAGTMSSSRVRARTVPTDGPAMRLGDQDGDWDAIRRCQSESVRVLPGPAARRDARWAELARTRYRYVLDGDTPGAVEAYLLIDHEQSPGDWQFTLSVADWAAMTPRGLRAVLALIGRHGTFADRVVFRDRLPSLWSMLLSEQDIDVSSAFYWMARGLDLEAAIGARGFPAGLAASVTLRVDDPVLPQRPWLLEVADGRGQLTSARKADVHLDVRAVGPLFTGFRTPDELALGGLLRGSNAACAVLAAAFAGPPPVLFDFF